MRKLRLQTQTVTLAPIQGGTIVFQELELDSNYSRCIGVCGVMVATTDNDSVRLSLKDNHDTFIENASSALFKSSTTIKPKQRFIKLNIPCAGNKIIVTAVIPKGGIATAFTMDLIYLLVNDEVAPMPRIKYQSQSVVIPIAAPNSKKVDVIALDPNYDKCTGLAAVFISENAADYVRLAFDDSFGQVINKVPQGLLVFNNAAEPDKRFYSVEIPAKGNHVKLHSEPFAVTTAEIDFDIIYRLEK